MVTFTLKVLLIRKSQLSSVWGLTLDATLGTHHKYLGTHHKYLASAVSLVLHSV